MRTQSDAARRRSDWSYESGFFANRENTMKVNESRSVLTLIATMGLFLAAVSADARAQTYLASQTQISGISTPRCYAPPAIRPLPRPTGVEPAISMALPSSGPYQSGLQFGFQTRQIGQQPMASPPSYASTSPFPTVAQQIVRSGANATQSPSGYLGTSYRATGQSMSRLAVRRALNGTVGLSGVMGLTAGG